MISTTKLTSGFSLIEVLIALSVMSVGVLGLLRLQTEIDKRAEHARQQTEALYLAENHLEALRRHSINGETTHIDINGVSTVLHANTIKFADIDSVPQHGVVGSYRLERVVTDVPESPPLSTAEPFAKHVQVTLTWLDRQGEEQSISLQTVIAAYNELD